MAPLRQVTQAQPRCRSGSWSSPVLLMVEMVPGTLVVLVYFAANLRQVMDLMIASLMGWWKWRGYGAETVHRAADERVVRSRQRS